MVVDRERDAQLRSQDRLRPIVACRHFNGWHRS
eukprot:COSAG02_NODE_52358_length_308_cov_0.813397_1_plen_32_part_10